MMDGPPFPAPVPRLASPRVRVEAGCVAVAGRQAVICPMPSPGGWPLLGRTPVRVLDLRGDPLTAYLPGDTFRFVPITPDEWDDYADLPLAACLDTPAAAHVDTAPAAHADTPAAAHRDTPPRAHRDTPAAARQDTPLAVRHG
ncbi:carboxyltransferase domain-containing protein, partial [Streptomyces sp. NPDC002920]